MAIKISPEGVSRCWCCKQLVCTYTHTPETTKRLVDNHDHHHHMLSLFFCAVDFSQAVQQVFGSSFRLWQSRPFLPSSFVPSPFDDQFHQFRVVIIIYSALLILHRYITTQFVWKHTHTRTHTSKTLVKCFVVWFYFGWVSFLLLGFANGPSTKREKVSIHSNLNAAM